MHLWVTAARKVVRMDREAIGVILIIFGWLGVISLMYTQNNSSVIQVLCVLIAFGGAWLMLSDKRRG